MDGEIWDEERWESFLKENDRRIEYYMTVLFRFMSENPPAGGEGSSARRKWGQELRQYLLGHGISPDDALPRLLSGNWADDDDGDDIFLSSDRPLPEGDDRDEAVHDISHLPAYSSAHRLATRVLRWSNELPGHVKDSTLVQYCSHVMQIPSNLAKGHGIGYEMEMIGGNIACAKRALAAANAALDLLRELKSESYMESRFYQNLYEDGFEVRNQIGIYVQELRRRFDLGVD